MAAADKLWFELGVRDEVSGVLETLMKTSEKLGDALTDDSAELKNYYRNIVDISNVYDKIHVTQKRIAGLKGLSLTGDQRKGLKAMSDDIEKARKEMAAIFKDPTRLLERGEVQFDKMRLNIELMLKDSLRYIDGIEEKDRAEAKNAANESKRIEDLKSKYYELQQYRKQLSDAIVNAAPGTDLTDATSLINSISGRMSAVRRAQANGSGLPSSTTGADYEEFLRKVKAELNGLSSATNDYNTKLEQNRQLQSTLQKLGEDAYSQQKIAGIRKQTAEYSALERKMRELAQLQVAIETEGLGLKNGTIKTPTYTKDKVTEELNAIQRRYNENLAAGRQREIEDAAAKTQKSAATRKAMEAVSALAHVNDGLISSYNRVAEAGSQANRITVQFQNQIGAYAGLYGLERILKSIVTIGGQFEVQHVALQNILGDVQQANILFGQMKELAIESPKTFMELTSYVKQLSAYQIPSNELFDTTKRLADLSSGLGVDMNRLILAYGQVRSAAVLRGQELRQFTEAGIPMVQALADKFTQLNGKLTTTADVFKLISARAVPFEMVKEVLWDMTNQGGQFYNMQSELADTLYGKWQKLQDSWQIMLGSIAEGTSASGAMFKYILDVVVLLTQNLDKMVFAMSAFGAAKGLKAIAGGLQDTVMRRSGEMAIRNMELAKIKEANRLERERIWNGKQLNAEELKLVQNKNRLVSSDYQILALENQISAKKAHQLMLDGKMSREHFYRTLQMQGYTREQRKQIALGNLQALQQGPNPTPLGKMGNMLGVGAKGLLGFFGGWVGVAITLAGTLYSVYEAFGEADERLQDLANSITGSAEQNANMLASVLKNVENSSDEPYKKVEALEEALLGMGVAGKQVVQESRGFDDMAKRLDNLTQKAKAYQEALDAMGTPQGNAMIKEALDNSDINDEMEEYEKLQNAEYKRMAALERYSSKYQQMIDSLKAKHKELSEQLNGKNLYENLRILLNGKYENEAVSYFAGNTPWGEAITEYAKAVEESEAHMQNIRDNVIPDAMDNLKTLARQAGVDISKSYEQLTEEEKTKLRTIATNFANGLEKGSQDAKDNVASWVAQGFYAQLYLTPVINTNELTGLALSLDEWQKGKGYGLWSKNDLKDANTDFLAFSTKQSQRKVDLEKKLKNFDTQLKGSILDPDLVPYIQDQKTAVESELKELNKSLDDGMWVFDKSLTKGNKGGGTKKDTELEALKNRVDLYKKFYQELEGYEDIYGHSGALDVLKKDGEFGTVFNWGIKDLSNYKQTLDQLTDGFNVNTEARHKFINATKADIENKQRKDAVESMKTYISELRKMMSVMSENYQTYKKWLELTGDASLASRVAGVAQNTTYADYLRNQMQTELGKNKKYSALTPEDVFGLSESDIQKFGKDSQIFAVWDEWRKHQQLLKKEQLDLYEEAIKNAKDYDDKIEDVNRSLEKQIAAIEALGGDNRLIGNARQNAADKVSELQWEKFKKENDWGRVFGDLDNMGFETIERMVTAMKKFQKETRLSEKESRAWQKAMKDLTDKKITLDPINALTDAVKKYNLAIKARNDAQKEKDDADKRVASIRGEVATSPQNAENREKRLNQAVKDQEKANKKLIKSQDDVTESFNQIKKAAAAIANSFKNLGGSLSSLGSSIGGDIGNVIGGFGTMFSSLGNGISAIQNLDMNAKGFTGIFNKVSAVLTVVSSMVDMNKALADILPSTESIYQRHAEEQKKINQLRAAIDSYRVAVEKAHAEEKGWIGDNPLRELQDAYKIHGAVVTEYYNKLYEAQEAYIDSAAGIKSALIPIVAAITAIVAVVAGAFSFGSGAVGVGALGAAAIGALSAGTVAVTGITAAAIGTAIAAGVGYAVGQAVQAGIDAITYDNGQVDARSNMKVQTQHRTFFRGEKTQNLEEWTKENLGLDLFDKSGLIDLKVAQAVLDSGITLVGETKETLEKLMELREQYDEWEKSIKDYISSTFGGLTNDMVNAIWDWLDGGKDALDSFHDYASDTFKQIAQDAVKTFLKVAVLDKFEQQLENLYKAYSMQDQNGNRIIDEQQLMLGVASVAGDMAIAFEQILPLAQTLGKTIANAFEFQGFDVVSGSNGGNSSMSNGIKSITEGTADLLASYINAIRADVSVNRTMIAMYYPQFLGALSQNNTIADAQLEQMKAIVNNTGRNVELVEMIYNILHGVAPEGTKIHIK